jgi:purine-binding chemotaxis protein CheW
MAQATRYCTFTLDGLLFGVEVERVQEVLASQRMTKVPLAPSTVGGLVNQRGHIVTALNLRKRLGFKEREDGREPMIIMIRCDDGITGWLVDEIGDVLETAAADFEPAPPTLQGIGRELIVGAFKLDKKLLLLLDVNKVLAQGESGRKSWTPEPAGAAVQP